MKSVIEHISQVEHEVNCEFDALQDIMQQKAKEECKPFEEEMALASELMNSLSKEIEQKYNKEV